MNSHKLRIHWKAEDVNHQSNPGISESTPPVLLWLMLIPLATNWHLWGNPPKPSSLHHSSNAHTHTYTPRKWIDLIHWAWGATLKGLSLYPWQTVKKRVVSISENHALVWLALWGSKWSFDKAFNGWQCSMWIRTFALYQRSSPNL